VKEREGIAAKIFAHAEPTIAGISAKLRMLAWHMNLEHAECANHDGVRTNELEPDEKIIASALADAGRIAGGAACPQSCAAAEPCDAQPWSGRCPHVSGLS
jgi:hypothetical protein